VELSSQLDIWLYFLLHAEKIDAEALPQVFSSPLISRAVRELKMLSQTDTERERYESRRKAQLDYNSDMKAARLDGKAEGKAEGLAEGKFIGVIQFCERLLQCPETPMERLHSLSLEELTRLAGELQTQILSRQ
jgi:flagellar biosynthesis/type III secretory pathway protein FliH